MEDKKIAVSEKNNEEKGAKNPALTPSAIAAVVAICAALLLLFN